MYTQCPACLTTFKVSRAQLEARGGMVRCGICSAVFHAEQRLLQVQLRAKAAPAPPETPVKNDKRLKNRRRSGRRRVDKLRAIDDKLARDLDIPTITELQKLGRSRVPWRPLLWSLGSLALLALLAGQFLFFYRNELATIPSWRPLVADFCLHAGCELRPWRDIGRIELLQTTIAPHPQYEGALRIRAALVNRAAFRQAWPGMEITLTGHNGDILARRTFSPVQYSETPAEDVLTPNVAATALLDVTNPDGKATGYEMRLVNP